MIYAYNPSMQVAKDCEFEASLCYIARPCLQKQELGK
jgi:hypothetical protein